MNVKLEIIPATLRLPVRILTGHIPVYVTKDTLEMGTSPVQVIVFSFFCIYMTIWSYNMQTGPLLHICCYEICSDVVGHV